MAPDFTLFAGGAGSWMCGAKGEWESACWRCWRMGWGARGERRSVTERCRLRQADPDAASDVPRAATSARPRPSRSSVGELAKAPDDVEARALLVRMPRLRGRTCPAAQVAATELAQHLPPGDPRAWIELGHAREVAHDFEGALAAYDTAASAAPAESPAGPAGGGQAGRRAGGQVEEAGAEARRGDPARGGGRGRLAHAGPRPGALA